MIKRILFALSILGITLTACAASSLSGSEDYYYPEDTILVEAERSVSDFEEQGYAGEATSGFNSELPKIERIVIKNAELTIVVDDPPQSMDRITQMADDMGGFVVSANLYRRTLPNGTEVPQASITIRVPSERLNEALTLIRSETDQPVINENVNSRDVTSDYTDLQSRLRNLESAEAQLQEIMDSAIKTEDVLDVYNELIRVREQIEIIKGQMQYIEQSAALSAVSVELVADEAVQPLTIGGWEPAGVAKEAVQTLIDALKFLVEAAIRIVIVVLPLLLVLFIPFALVIWLVRRWRSRRKAKREESPPEIEDQPVE
jgi:hypothetical protein